MAAVTLTDANFLRICSNLNILQSHQSIAIGHIVLTDYILILIGHVVLNFKTLKKFPLMLHVQDEQLYETI